MAVTSIWRVKVRLDTVILYAANEKKTVFQENIPINSTESRTENPLESVINYVERDNATEKQLFVSGINCSNKNAFKEMLNIKKKFGKTGGTLAYHGYQSFCQDEVTPEIAHQIGCELAERLWGERYQVLVTTHLDKKSHLHNHYVLNTVSFVDGIKYHRTNSDYDLMRKISDELCLEYGLSIIKNPKKRSHKNYAQYMAEKNGEWNKDAIIRRDIDECISESSSPKGFYLLMQGRGYYFNFDRKYPTISHPNFERARRFKTLGENYTPEKIEERILSDWYPHEVIIPEQDNLVNEYFIPLSEPNYKEIYVAFVTVVERVKKRPDTNRGIDKYLVDEMRKLDRLIEQQNLLCDNDIETDEQLNAFKKENETELNEILEARHRLRNMVKKAERRGDEAEVISLKDSIGNLTERAKILRKNIKICDRIEDTKPNIETKIETIKKDYERKELDNNEHFGRSSGRNRKNEFTRR